jgi:hypothetical protein
MLVPALATTIDWADDFLKTAPWAQDILSREGLSGRAAEALLRTQR